VRARSVEALLLDYLHSLTLPALPADQQSELDALAALSDDALYTIAREQVAADVQARAHDLMTRNNLGQLTEAERAELQDLVDRADRVMLRKAEAAALLVKRGRPFHVSSFKS
jgi:hypothetical protein